MESSAFITAIKYWENYPNELWCFSNRDLQDFVRNIREQSLPSWLIKNQKNVYASLLHHSENQSIPNRCRLFHTFSFLRKSEKLQGSNSTNCFVWWKYAYCELALVFRNVVVVAYHTDQAILTSLLHMFVGEGYYYSTLRTFRCLLYLYLVYHPRWCNYNEIILFTCVVQPVAISERIQKKSFVILVSMPIYVPFEIFISLM